MGYYTEFELQVLEGRDNSIDYEAEIIALSGYRRLFRQGYKWYEWRFHMQKFSQIYPNTLFCLNGQGEDMTDVWKAYFQNGKIFFTKATLVFEEFSPEKLQ
jgi:hypothetical protein